MKIDRRSRRCWIVWLCGLAFLTGCGSAPPVHFYQLNALPYSGVDESSSHVDKEYFIGIGPVDIPSYVDRVHMVIRAGETELQLLEFDRWAEPLQKNLSRVLVDNLSQLLESHGATVLRWDEGLPLDYRVRIEVMQLDFTNTGDVSLIARWIMLEKEEKEPLVIQTSRFTGSSIPGDYSSLVAEMSRHVESLSREIAEALTAHL